MRLKLKFEQQKLGCLLCWSWRNKLILVSEWHGTIFEAIVSIYFNPPKKGKNKKTQTKNPPTRKSKKYSSEQSMDLPENFSSISLTWVLAAVSVVWCSCVSADEEQNQKTVSSYSIPSPCVTIIAWVPNMNIKRITVFLLCHCFMYESGFNL